MASSVEDGSPSHGDTSGESSKESIPLMDGEVPEGVPRGEPLTKAAADRSTVETHSSLHELLFLQSGLSFDEALWEIIRSIAGDGEEERGPQPRTVHRFVAR